MIHFTQQVKDKECISRECIGFDLLQIFRWIETQSIEINNFLTNLGISQRWPFISHFVQNL
jgi:hypothetical protein